MTACPLRVPGGKGEGGGLGEGGVTSTSVRLRPLFYLGEGELSAPLSLASEVLSTLFQQTGLCLQPPRIWENLLFGIILCHNINLVRNAQASVVVVKGFIVKKRF